MNEYPGNEDPGNQDPDTDDTVVIAGAGPVGLMLACELGLAGVRTVVIEPLAERSNRSPGVAVNAGLVETLDDRGLMEPLREETFVLPAVHFSLIWLDPSAQREPHADAYMLPQSRLEQHLEERALRLGADLRRGHRVVGFDQDPDGVTVAVDCDTGGYRLRGRFLVGCDGAESAVRTLAGIGFPGTEDLECSGIVGDVEFDMDDTDPEHFGAHLSPAGGVYMGAPAGEGLLRAMTFDWASGTAGRDDPVTAEEFRAVVRRITGRQLRGEPLWLARYRSATRQAERYRLGRAFLAGDAAHLMVPLNGLAMSTGFQDAVNLGWKLAADIRGWAPEGLLDTYHDERHPAGGRVCRDVQAQAELLNPPRRVAPLRAIISELLRFDDVQHYLIEAVTGLGVRYPLAATGRPHSLVGARLPQLPLVCDGAERSTSELLHAGRGVLLDLSRRASLTADVDLSGWKDRVDLVAAEPAPGLAATALLLRPDGHVAWAANDGDGDGDTGFEAARADLTAALERWFGPASTGV